MHINCVTQQEWGSGTENRAFDMDMSAFGPLNGQLFGLYCHWAGSVDDAALCIAGHKFQGSVREYRLFALFANWQEQELGTGS